MFNRIYEPKLLNSKWFHFTTEFTRFIRHHNFDL